MKRVLFAGVLSVLVILGAPTLASSAERGHDSRDGGGNHNSHSDRGDRDRSDRGGYYSDGRYYYGDPYYYGGYDECHRDPSGTVTCEPYGGYRRAPCASWWPPAPSTTPAGCRPASRRPAACSSSRPTGPCSSTPTPAATSRSTGCPGPAPFSTAATSGRSPTPRANGS